MMKKVFEIMIKDYIILEGLWGMGRVQDIAEKYNIECFPVTDNGKIVGVLTKNDLIKSHPNRIVLDAMTGNFKYIEFNESIWKANDFLKDEKIDILLVIQEDKIIGIITKNSVAVEIAKHIDLLTGLYKRDYIIHKTLELIEERKELSIIFFDVNDFGYINKEFGHIMGDVILQETAQILKDNLPPRAYLCRYGGDEFALLTEDCTEICKILAQKMITTVKQYKFNQNMNITISAGIAGGKSDNSRVENIYKTVTSLINIASLASTKAKKENSNLVLGFNGIIDEIAI